MPRKHQTLRRTIVIVCEDSVLTPTYLRKIKEDVIENGEWSNIDIFPVPPPDVTTVKNNVPHKSPRKRRTFLPEEKHLEFEIEDEYKAVPVRYVREAQLRIEESGYNEGWAVYDLNGHAKHAEAFDLSYKEPIIKLAFNSIAIEHWFLLHFVRDNTAYKKSMHVPLATHIPNYTKNVAGALEAYQNTKSRLEVALENTAWLRTINSNNNKRIYEINPYIDMDLLLKSLYGIPENIQWGFLGSPAQIKGIGFLINKNNNRIQIRISNHSKTGIVPAQTTLYLLNAERIRHEIDVTYPLLAPNKSIELYLELPSPGLLNICVDNDRLIIEV